MDVTPGVIHDGGADTGAPVAIVSSSPARVSEYLTAAPIGQYVVVHGLADLPAGVQLGGVAVLDRKPMPEALAQALVRACLEPH